MTSATIPLLEPGDPGYDDERTGYQLAGPHRPDVLVAARDAADVREGVALAARRGLPVAVQATGHGRPQAAAGGVLISTRRLDGVSVDPVARTARLQAGVRWQAVIDAAAPHGLAPLSGSAPGVGAVSYTLGGGIGLLARRHGYAADHVVALDVVTADVREREVSADAEPDLFWALRGGRAAFGVVTGLELGLVEVGDFYGGGLYVDADAHAEAALAAWREMTEQTPDELTSSVAVIPFPDVPHLPEPLRGRRVAHVRIALLGDAAAGERLVAPLRAAAPVLLDTLGPLPYARSGEIHADPPTPMAFRGRNVLLDGLDDEAIRALAGAAAGAGAPPVVVEVRHLGGALARPPAVPSAVGRRDAAFSLGVLTRLPADDAPAVEERVLGAMAPWTREGHVLNFLYGEAATEAAVRAAFEPADYARLQALKAAYDPEDRFRLNHRIPPAAA